MKLCFSLVLSVTGAWFCFLLFALLLWSWRNSSKKINKKKVDTTAKIFYLSLAMNAIEIETAIYCGETVELLSIENTIYGNLAFIRFEDGREDQVPLNTIDF